jgi:uracil-DNA glycosylase
MLDERTRTISWQAFLEKEKKAPYFQKLLSFLTAERLNKTIYPPEEDVFNALKLTPFETVKVVIIGQDPYHGPNQAMGLSFSVREGLKKPPSLNNIFKALKKDLALSPPEHGSLEAWARQGVLLLNATLTVEAHKAGSHAKIGWQHFTDKIISTLNTHDKPIIYLLWGAYAQKKETLINTHQHHILRAPHPSPLSAHRGFLDCQHFSKTNTLLKKAGRTPINWQL